MTAHALVAVAGSRTPSSACPWVAWLQGSGLLTTPGRPEAAAGRGGGGARGKSVPGSPEPCWGESQASFLLPLSAPASKRLPSCTWQLRLPVTAHPTVPSCMASPRLPSAAPPPHSRDPGVLVPKTLGGAAQAAASPPFKTCPAPALLQDRGSKLFVKQPHGGRGLGGQARAAGTPCFAYLVTTEALHGGQFK